MAGPLQDRLDRMKAGFEKTAPPEALAVMHGATAALRASDIMAGVRGVGQTAPDFTLNDSFRRPTRLADLLANGPVVLTFFRGDW